MSQSIEFLIPDAYWLTANGRDHWAAKSRRTRALRHLGQLRGRLSGLSNLGATKVTATIGYPRNGKSDPANAAPTVKALIDGLVDAGVWADDDSEHVVATSFKRGPKCAARHHLVLLELEAANAA